MLTRTSTTLLDGLRDPGDRAAWAEFNERYRPPVLAVARRLGLQDADAEDVAQETMAAFVQAYRENRYAREQGALGQWLRGIARNKVRDALRKRGREPLPLADRTDGTGRLERIEDPERLDAFWDEEWEKAVLRQCLDEVRREVEPRTYEAFLLVALRGWPARRVAEHLQISEEVVYQAKSRVLARVRELLPQLEKDW